MKRKSLFILFFIVTGLLLLVACIMIYNKHQEDKRHQKAEREQARLEEQIQNSYHELIEFASAHIEEIENVSQLIVNKKEDHPEHEPFDYKNILQGESEDVIKDFECIFNKVLLVNFGSHYLTDYMEYAYDYIEGTEIRIIYFGDNSESKEAGIETYNKYGEVTKITENIYVVYYAFPYV